MEDYHKLNAVLQERHDLRLETIEMERSMHKSVFFFLTLAGVAGTIFWQDAVISKPEVRQTVLFALSQVEFFLGMFVIALISNQNVHAGYIKALEKKINKLCDEQISMWEQEATAKFLFLPGSSFFVICAIIIVTAILFAVFAIYAAFDKINNFAVGFILAVEVIALLVTGIMTGSDARRVERSISETMGV